MKSEKGKSLKEMIWDTQPGLEWYSDALDRMRKKHAKAQAVATIAIIYGAMITLLLFKIVLL